MAPKLERKNSMAPKNFKLTEQDKMIANEVAARILVRIQSGEFAKEATQDMENDAASTTTKPGEVSEEAIKKHEKAIEKPAA